jgi:hypothetical protein
MKVVMRRLAVLLVPAAALTAAPAAHAATTTVHFSVQLAAAVPVAGCDVSVPEGSNGIAVLDAAVASQCISSYQKVDTQFGPKVTCINDVCEAPDATLNVVYWAIYVDSGYAQVGAGSLAFPADGSSLRFSYETWVTGLVPQP